ncbi:hypothetical protein ABZX12_42720 [Kribbella sp. NPDC003505]|uniref:AlbA family DNA-binding domain-containing protein n=1 Tax=Kribbella sp. NPDC003505 TaxID=3154448 RepID=UPI0033BF9900
MTVRLYRGPAYGRAVDDYLRSSTGQLVPLGADPILPIDWFAEERVNDIANAVRGLIRQVSGMHPREALDDASIDVRLTSLPGDDFKTLLESGEELTSDALPIQLDIGRAVTVRIVSAVPAAAAFTRDDIVAVARKSLPRGLSVAGVEIQQWISAKQLVTVEMRLSQRGRLMLGEVVRASEHLISALAVADLDAARAFSLVTGGRVDLLLGLRESQWLEVKRDAYRLDDRASCIEAAQDVARLANGGTSALLLCGVKAKRLPGGGERITQIAPFSAAVAQARRLRSVLDNYVYPQVAGLQVTFVTLAETADGVLAIYVPQQAARLRPFLVHGAIAAGKTEGAFISIVSRRDDDSVPITAAQIHPFLAGALAQDPEDEMDHLDDSRQAMSRGLVLTPRHHPSQYADPLEFRCDASALCLRVVQVLRPTLPAPFKIEPRHRKRFLTELNVDETLPWEHSIGSHQSTTHAVFIRRLSHDESHRLTLTKASISDHILVIADDVILKHQDAELTLADVVDRWTRLLRRCSSDLRGAVSLVIPGTTMVDAIEIHIEPRGALPSGRTWTIGDFVDLTPLGAGRDRGPTQGASAWPSSWLTSGAERSLALEALRDNAHDWGYLDPDPAMTQFGWQAG